MIYHMPSRTKRSLFASCTVFLTLAAACALAETDYEALSIESTAEIGDSYSVSSGSLDVVTATGTSRRPLKQTFPRLGNLQIGGTPKSYTNESYRDLLSRYDLILLGRSYGQGAKTARAIKQRNPKAFVGQYTNINAVPLRRKSAIHTALREKLYSEQGPTPRGTSPDWWLREKVARVNGEWVGDADGDGIGDIVEVSQFGNGRANITRWTKPDANGDRWPEWKVSFDYRKGMNKSDFDVWYFDATNFKLRAKGFPRGTAAMDFSGTNTSRSVVEQAWRDGYVSAWDRVEKLRPDIYIIGNHDWYNYVNLSGDLPSGNGFTKRIDGGLLENVMRPTGGPEKKKNGWQTVYKWYRHSMDFFRTPDLTFFTVMGDLKHHSAIDGRPANSNASHYQWFRYTFATALMQNGYYVYRAKDYPSGSSLWFDEYDRAGRDDTSWMGRGIAGPSNPGAKGPSNPWKQGVYRRDFENAVVLVNPRGNGKKTISLEGGLRKLRGQQDSRTNNGRTVQSVTLNDSDGIILVRRGYAR
jgi:hypothetical protein